MERNASTSCPTHCDRAACSDANRMKYSDPSSATRIASHRSGVRPSPVVSRKTRMDLRRYQGVANRWSRDWMTSARRPSAAWLYDRNALYRKRPGSDVFDGNSGLAPVMIVYSDSAAKEASPSLTFLDIAAPLLLGGGLMRLAGRLTRAAASATSSTSRLDCRRHRCRSGRCSPPRSPPTSATGRPA